MPVAGGLTLTSLSSGAFHVCGLTSDGTAYCWGYNVAGALGDGTTTDRSSPVPVSGGLRFASLRAGGRHTCGLTSAGAAYCWGSNEHGQLGNGDASRTNRLAPALVSGSLTFDRIALGFRHTCALTASNEAYCWGSNSGGQLGDRTNVDRGVPTRMMP